LDNLLESGLRSRFTTGGQLADFRPHFEAPQESQEHMMRTLHWFLFKGRRAADGGVTRMMHPHAVDSEKNMQAPWAHFSLCPFSQIAIRVMKLVNNEDTPLAQVSALISSDPAFSAEVLRIANSLW
jgi:hypothetical protein